MRYIKIRADFKYGPKGRFYRVLLVRENMSLIEFGFRFVLAMHGTLEHPFTFSKGKSHFLPASFMDSEFENEYWMGHYDVEDLGESFDFNYDMGDCWDFHIRACKKRVERDSDSPLVILEGAGMGIWEDNIGVLYALFDGEIDPNQSEENEEEGSTNPGT